MPVGESPPSLGFSQSRGVANKNVALSRGKNVAMGVTSQQEGTPRLYFLFSLFFGPLNRQKYTTEFVVAVFCFTKMRTAEW